MTQRVYIDCECATEAVCVENWPEDKQICLAFFNMGHEGNRLSWKNRFRYIWRIISTGYPYLDMVMIDYKKAKNLISILSKYIEKEI